MVSDRRGPDRWDPRRLAGRTVALAGAVLAIAAVVALTTGGGGPPPLPPPGIGRSPTSGDPFGYAPGRGAAFTSRAVAGSIHVLFTKSPGGVLATAARVAPYRTQIDAACKGTGIDPNVLEAIVFLESAGRPDAIAADDLAGAAGLTQIIAQTGMSLLGMHIDLQRSKVLTAAIARAAAFGPPSRVDRLERQRARADDRFDPRKALAATVRYLLFALRQLGGRSDLAVESYHMGVGNLQDVLGDYDGGRPVPYVQLFFDTAPDRHGAAYRLLSGFGDDSWLYYWRILGAEQIMRLYRSDRTMLTRLAALQTAVDSAAYVLHPPGATKTFADPTALEYAYGDRTIVPLPRNASALGLAYDPSLGVLAHQLHVRPALYRGLRMPALDLLIELAGRVRALSRGLQPLILASAVTDARYQGLLGVPDFGAESGWSFSIDRRYVNGHQAAAFQAMLDRLQALDVIAWERFPSVIEVTVASDAAHVIAHGV